MNWGEWDWCLWVFLVSKFGNNCSFRNVLIAFSSYDNDNDYDDYDNDFITIAQVSSILLLSVADPNAKIWFAFWKKES